MDLSSSFLNDRINLTLIYYLSNKEFKNLTFKLNNGLYLNGGPEERTKSMSCAFVASYLASTNVSPFSMDFETFMLPRELKYTLY